MRRVFAISLIVLFLLSCGCSSSQAPGTQPSAATGGTADAIVTQAAVQSGSGAARMAIVLPDPRYDSDTSVEEALKNRRSVRSFTADPVTVSDVSQLLWAAQGITSESGQRTAPSAQRLYPLQLYVIVKNVTGLEQGIYRYEPDGHQLETVDAGDAGSAVSVSAPVAFVIAIDLDKKPGARPAAASTPSAGSAPAENAGAPATAGAAPPAGAGSGPSEETIHSWYYAETGHAAQNMYLQAASLGLGMVTQAGFDPDALGSALELTGNVTPYYMIPAGHPA